MTVANCFGVDFTSAPTRHKPVILATGELTGSRLRLCLICPHESLSSHAAAIQSEASWIGAFDLPFGLPRELVECLGWPTDWPACMAHYTSLSRAEIRDQFAAFCATRPVGSKFAHRACDGPAGSSPSMKWVNPPVAYMMHAGVPILLKAGAYLPGVMPPGPEPFKPPRVALEAYPGLLAREILGKRSYKSDDKAKQTPERLIARKDLVDALEQGRTRLGLRIVLTHAQREALVEDASGDTLDAVLCLMQAAWASEQPNWGLPDDVDPLEGWIVSAQR